MSVSAQKWVVRLAGGLSVLLLASLFRLYLFKSFPVGPSAYETSFAFDSVTQNVQQIAHNSSAPLYSLLLHGLSKLHFYQLLGPAQILWTFRYLSVIFSILTVVAIYAASSKLFGKRVGLITGFFWAILFPVVISSRTIGARSMALFFLAMIFYCVSRAEKKIAAPFFIISFIGLILTEASAVFFFIPAAIILGTIILQSKSGAYEKIMYALFILLGMGSIALMVISDPTRLYLVPPNYFWHGFSALLFYPGPSNPAFNTALVPIFDPLMRLLLILTPIYLLSHRSKKLHLLMVCALAAGLLSGIFKSSAGEGSFNLFFLPAVIAAAIVFDFGLESWLKLFPLNKSAKSAGVVTAIIFLSLSMFYSYGRTFTAFNLSPESRRAYHEGIVEVAGKLNSKQVFILGDKTDSDALTLLTHRKNDFNYAQLLPEDLEDLKDKTVVIDMGAKHATEANIKFDGLPNKRKQIIKNNLDEAVFIVWNSQ